MGNMTVRGHLGLIMPIPALQEDFAVSSPTLMFSKKKQGIAILEKIHGGACGNHFVGHCLANKALSQGYW